MKKVYICARVKYKKDTSELSKKLEEIGYEVWYAAKDTPQNIADKEIYRHNLKLIRNADLFLAYFVRDGHYGTDFAVEVGKASEMGKPVIGLVNLPSDRIQGFKDRLDKDIMFKHSFTTFFWSIRELVNYLRN